MELNEFVKVTSGGRILVQAQMTVELLSCPVVVDHSTLENSMTEVVMAGIVIVTMIVFVVKTVVLPDDETGQTSSKVSVTGGTEIVVTLGNVSGGNTTVQGG